MKRKKNDALLALKLVRKKSREEEIAAFGHAICYKKVFVDRTKYNRKRDKANRQKGGSPYFLWYKEQGIRTKCHKLIKLSTNFVSLQSKIILP